MQRKGGGVGPCSLGRHRGEVTFFLGLAAAVVGVYVELLSSLTRSANF